MKTHSSGSRSTPTACASSQTVTANAIQLSEPSAVLVRHGGASAASRARRLCHGAVPQAASLASAALVPPGIAPRQQKPPRAARSRTAVPTRIRSVHLASTTNGSEDDEGRKGRRRRCPRSRPTVEPAGGHWRGHREPARPEELPDTSGQDVVAGDAAYRHLDEAGGPRTINCSDVPPAEPLQDVHGLQAGGREPRSSGPLFGLRPRRHRCSYFGMPARGIRGWPAPGRQRR